MMPTMCMPTTHWSREAWSHPVHPLGIELSLSLLLALVQSHIEGLGDEDAAVHLCHSFSGLFWGAETDKAKALGGSPLIAHDLKEGGREEGEGGREGGRRGREGGRRGRWERGKKEERGGRKGDRSGRGERNGVRKGKREGGRKGEREGRGRNTVNVSGCHYTEVKMMC